MTIFTILTHILEQCCPFTIMPKGKTRSQVYVTRCNSLNICVRASQSKLNDNYQTFQLYDIIVQLKVVRKFRIANKASNLSVIFSKRSLF